MSSFRYVKHLLNTDIRRKTTVIIFKMLALESLWMQNPYTLDSSKPRQLFVTKSQVLANRVQRFFGRLFDAHILGEDVGTSEHDDDNEDLLRGEEDAVRDANLPWRLSELTDDNFPLFLSYDRVG